MYTNISFISLTLSIEQYVSWRTITYSSLHPFRTDEMEWCIKYLELLSFMAEQEMRKHCNKTKAFVIDIQL